MGVLFQLAIGLCPAVILFLILTLINIKKKGDNRILHIVMLCVFGVAAIALTVAGIVAPASSGLVAESTGDLQLQIACAVANEGEYDLSLELLDSLRAEGADAADTTEYTAWIYAAKGDARAAKAMFAKANMLDGVDDYDSIVALCDKILAGTTKVKDLTKLAADKFDEMTENDDVQAAGEALVKSQKLYDTFLNGEEIDSKDISKVLSNLEDACESTPSLSRIQSVRVCRTKLMTLTGKFDQVAESLDENACFDEYAIAAELYINDLVDSDSFADTYGADYAKKVEAVTARIQKLEPKIDMTDPNNKHQYKNLMDTLDKFEKDPAIGRLSADLSTFANDDKSPDQPKAHMQLARLAYAEGKDDMAEEHISAALNTVGVSDDENFYAPMIGIVDSITDKDDVEKVKNIAQYAKDVTENTSDYIVVKSIEQYQQAAQQETPDKPQIQNNGNKNEEETDKRNPFEVFFADKASQKRNAFSITGVDATDFETVKLVVNVDPSISITADELKRLIQVKDCGVNIEDFTVEKVEYSGANILLCCDVSGSMGGTPINDLKKAVAQFVESSTDIENLALVTFDGQVQQAFQFGTEKDLLSSAASQFYPMGGTNMFGALEHSVTMFSPKANELNFILLLSDGEDNTIPSDEIIRNTIGSTCKEQGIVLYSLGLGGDVNTPYMNALASSTGGYFVYVSDSATLDDFYTKLRSQILNRYIITYTAKDTLRASRNVTVSLKDAINSNIVSDTKDYVMKGTDADANAPESNDTIAFENLTVSGLDTKRVFKSTEASTVNLLGSGFAAEMSFSIKLDGKLDYADLAYQFVDAQTIRVTLPGGMACGAYDLEVIVDGKTGLFPKELTVSVPGSEKTTTFGNYVFTSDYRIESENMTTLSGYVTMNGWLHFEGDVVLNGSLEEQHIEVTDQSGSYVRYYADTAVGLAGLLAKSSPNVPFAPLGTFTLYNDAFNDGESTEHRVDKIPVPIVTIHNFLSYETPSIEVYPNKLSLHSDGFKTKFPLQNSLLKAGGAEDLFRFKAAVGVDFTNKEIGMNLHITNKAEYNEKDDYKIPANFGNQPLELGHEYEVKIDTVKDEYMVELGVGFTFIDEKDDDSNAGLSLMLEWAKRDGDSGLQSLAPKTVEIGADFEIPATIGPVPVTYSDFKIALTDIDPKVNILKWKLTGAFDLSTVKLSTYLKGIAKFIDDPPLFKFDDTKVSLSLGQFYLGFETEAKFLDAITLGKLSVDAGKFDYTCALLDMYDQSTIGLKAALTAGIMWKTDNVDLNVSGTGIINLHSRFLGLEMQGVCDLEVGWWIFEKSFYAEGRAIIGMMNSDGPCFVIKIRETTPKGGTVDTYLYFNGKHDWDCGTKKL